MSTNQPKQTYSFQTEVRQLLDLMINSLYSSKDIFLRELISNGSDAINKLRFDALTNEDLYEGDSNFKILISIDKDAATIRVSDNGIGMSHDEIIDNLGTIAKSGTKKFFESLSGDTSKDAQLIGQFGVGFYSSFMVSDHVHVFSRRAGLPVSEGVHWQSSGDGTFSLELAEVSRHGTTVELHLREALRDEFLDDFNIRNIIRRYSNHISIPVVMQVPAPFDDPDKETDDEDAVVSETTETTETAASPPEPEEETINSATALWTRSKDSISDSEYKMFYKQLGRDFEDPIDWTHSHIEGNLEYISLLYIPTKAPFDLWDRNVRRGIQLYVQRVFIMDNAEELMPPYLRFVRGIIDCANLPLNVSREILQKNKSIDTIRTASVKKILDMIMHIAKDELQTYEIFWEQFGKTLKEGIVEHDGNLETIKKLLRFASTQDQSGKPSVSLADYVERMQADQKRIYYITAESDKTARNSPHLERFIDRGIEVLLLTDPIDEWAVSALTSFDDKPLQSAAKGILEDEAIAADSTDTTDAETETETEAGADAKDAKKSSKAGDDELLEWIHKALGERVKKVRASSRLVRSPACLVVGEHEIGARMQRILKSAGQDIPETKPILEINITHPLVQHLHLEKNPEQRDKWAHLLFDQALLSEGGHLDDPVAFIQRTNDIVLGLLPSSSKATDTS